MHRMLGVIQRRIPEGGEAVGGQPVDGAAMRQRFTFIGGLARPHGLALHNGYLYVGDTMGIWRVPYKDGQTRADARAEKATSKVSNLAPSNGH
jgi:glucose/arabinose dehydrogenase